MPATSSPEPERPRPSLKPNCYQDLPAPVLIFTGREHYVADGHQCTRFLLTVRNKSAFPPELFTSAPEFGACAGQDASRTSLDVYARDGTQLEGFCTPSSLNRFSFGVPIDRSPPLAVYIVLKDHRCNLSYSSNLAQLPDTLLEEHKALLDIERFGFPLPGGTLRQNEYDELSPEQQQRYLSIPPAQRRRYEIWNGLGGPRN